ncbi:hypothetical protein HAX54_022740, partial [Datura stramonium]|nr:hypothetical protein [Datura stramonium]
RSLFCRSGHATAVGKPLRLHPVVNSRSVTAKLLPSARFAAAVPRTKARTIMEELEFCCTNNLSNNIVEIDSLALINFIEGKWEVPWSVAMEVNYINLLKRKLSARVQHAFREGNALTDYYNLVFVFAGNFQFSNFQEMPSEGRRILNLEKMGTHQIRRRIIHNSSAVHSGANTTRHKDRHALEWKRFYLNLIRLF